MTEGRPNSEPGHIPAGRPALHVDDVAALNRYEARLAEDGPLAALVSYEQSATWIALLHTEVQEGFEGQGISGQLVAWIIADARMRGLAVIPRCPFVIRWLERHPDQQDVLSHPLPTPDPDPDPPGGPPRPA
jgi:predicted GNAT family acetyltransferase